ncbi:MAG: hypothetical protein PHR51_00895 [Patescibacteria group bacterium]|nr:hypothetical protein [Patescibacteria group bacterium]
MIYGRYQHLANGVAWFLAGWLAFGFPFSYFQFTPSVRAGGATMYLLWDSTNGDPPDGWVTQSGSGDPAYQRFLRGDAAVSALSTGGNEAGIHNHTLSNMTVSTNIAGAAYKNNRADTVDCALSHSHNILASFMDDATILPKYRDLVLIMYEAGMPDFLPADVIVGFASGASIPSGFTQYSSQNTNFVRLADATGSSTGSNTHTHTNVAIILDVCDTISLNNRGANVVASEKHFHQYSGTSPTGDHTPPSTGLPLYSVDDADTPLPTDMIAFFNASPPTWWTSLSESGGDFYQKYIYGNSTYATGTGSATHNHPGVTQLVTGAAVDPGPVLVDPGTPSASAASSTHTHTITTPTYSNENNDPPYINVVVAKYDPPDLTWSSGILDSYTIYESGTLTWGAGTEVCSATLTDDNSSTVECSGDGIDDSTQYRIDVVLKNVGSVAAHMYGGSDTVTFKNIIGGWAGTTPTIGSCGFYDSGSDDTGTPSCTPASGANDVILSNIGASSEVILAASSGLEGFMLIVTTDSDATTSSTSYMDTIIDTNSEDSSKITVSLASALGITAPDNIVLAASNPGAVSETTFETDELVVVTDGGSGWSLTAAMQTTFSDGGSNTIPDASVYLHKDGNVETEDEYTIWSGDVENVTETDETVSLDESRSVGTRSSGTGGDTTNVRPTIKIIMPVDQAIADYDGVIRFTVV